MRERLKYWQTRPQICVKGHWHQSSGKQRFGGSCHSFYFLFILQSHTFIITFVKYTHPSPFAEVSLENKESIALHLSLTFLVRKNIATKKSGKIKKEWHNTEFVFNIATSLFVRKILKKTMQALLNQSYSTFFVSKGHYHQKILEDFKGTIAPD